LIFTSENYTKTVIRLRLSEHWRIIVKYFGGLRRGTICDLLDFTFAELATPGILRLLQTFGGYFCQILYGIKILKHALVIEEKEIS